jgi:uncharacterized repeat protein (TIGR01451 family)
LPPSEPTFTHLGDTVRKSLLVVPAAALLTVAGVSSFTSANATTGIDLSMTGSAVAGVTSAQWGVGQEVAFTYALKNKSTTASANVSFTFTITNGTAPDPGDYICPLIRNHFDILPDTPACEPGALGAGGTAQAAILATPSAAGTMTVKACAQNLSATVPDPVSSNNCKTLSVKIAA